MHETIADRLRIDRLPPDRTLERLTDVMSLRGKRILIIGGTGPNLGHAIAHRVASLGADVVLAGRDGERTQAAAEGVAALWGVSARGVCGDVTDVEQASRLVTESIALLGGLDVLVHNAGGAFVDGKNRNGPFMSCSREDVDALVQLNLMSVFHVVRPTLAHMVDQGHGRLILVASEGAKVGLPNYAVYAACKAAVLGLVRNLAPEVGERGVSVVSVSPGLMLGDALLERLRGIPADSAEVNHLAAFDRVTLGRCARPDEVASVIAFLASDAAAYVHGTDVSVGGGLSG
jgi:NAD(P)-dependent dehydrogenase (short-subunit alcohol dehydrogenase family)